MAHPSRSRLYPQAASGSGEHHEEDFRTGDRVCHERWGEGLVLYTEGEGENRKIMVSFGGLKKKLLLKYARLERI
jgi:DNA helicase-2/ATP-dependent DNA helicase PcrA